MIVLGIVLVIANLILNVLVSKGKAKRPLWLTPVGFASQRRTI